MWLTWSVIGYQIAMHFSDSQLSLPLLRLVLLLQPHPLCLPLIHQRRNYGQRVHHETESDEGGQGDGKRTK